MEQNIKFHRIDKPVFIMMVGLAGSGKSTCASQIEIDKDGEVYKPNIHSSDTLRAEMFGDERDQEHNNEVFAELHKRIKADLQAGKDVIYDATNINKKRRAAFLSELKRFDCIKVCVCVMTPYETCLKFNENRERTIPENAIRKMYMNWTPPHVSEGFNCVIPVFNYGNERTTKYNIASLFERINKIDQENRHHSLTIGDHCAEACEYITAKRPDDSNLKAAALLHDIGKEFTKTYINSRGENDGEAHYYQHQCVGAYDAMFYLNEAEFNPEDQLYVSNLIYYHMHPYMAWEQSQKAMNRDKHMMGDKMFNDVTLLHEADAYAHIPVHEFGKNLGFTNQEINGEGEIEIER